jgi:hypothetical protein
MKRKCYLRTHTNFNILSLDNDIDRMVMSLIPEDMTLKKGVAGLGLGLILSRTL